MKIERRCIKLWRKDEGVTAGRLVDAEVGLRQLRSQKAPVQTAGAPA